MTRYYKFTPSLKLSEWLNTLEKTKKNKPPYFISLNKYDKIKFLRKEDAEVYVLTFGK